MPNRPEHEGSGFDDQEGGLDVLTPPPEQGVPKEQGRVSPLKEALRSHAAEKRVEVPRNAPAALQTVRELKDMIVAKVARDAARAPVASGKKINSGEVIKAATKKAYEQHREILMQKEEAARKKIQEIVRQPEGKERVVRAMITTSITKKENPAFVAEHAEDRDDIRDRSSFGALRRKAGDLLASHNEDGSLLTEHFDDEENIPEVQPLLTDPSFTVEPEPQIQYRKSQEPQGIFARASSWVKSWFR